MVEEEGFTLTEIAGAIVGSIKAINNTTPFGPAYNLYRQSVMLRESVVSPAKKRAEHSAGEFWTQRPATPKTSDFHYDQAHTAAILDELTGDIEAQNRRGIHLVRWRHITLEVLERAEQKLFGLEEGSTE
jgi:hypothetical protein